jgi:UDP-2,3-diacylglucosamine pyrophosphatase LpxH
MVREPSLGLVIMGHTHRAALTRGPHGGEYLNPGAWFDGFRYATVGPAGCELRRFGGSD